MGWLCLLALWLPIAATGAEALPELHGHVNDYAQVLGARAAGIDAQLTEHERVTGDQVVVLTVTDLGGQDIESYSNAVFTQWRLGHKGVDNGVLIIVAVNDHRTRIEVGYGLEGRLTDLASSQILRQAMHPRFASGDYAGGVEAGVEGVLAVLGNDSVAAGAAATDDSPQGIIAREGFFASGAWLFVLFTLLFVVMFTWMTTTLGGLWSYLLLGPLCIPLLRFVFPWSVVGGSFALYLVVAWWLRRRKMRLEYDIVQQGSNNARSHRKASVTAWPPSLWQVLTWSGPSVAVVAATHARKGRRSRGRADSSSSSSTFDSSSSSSDSSSSSSDYSGDGGSSGGGGASDSW
ncbi:TPM domain-containing protein [Dyella silvatica]|uniref:TPM domain-containing protein n=1 Tax=Dyella silvatica TaxID=2992128 RepID=UPI0022583E32|nr:TPM domain-containing protein [Dyella silvatica]